MIKNTPHRLHALMLSLLSFWLTAGTASRAETVRTIRLIPEWELSGPVVMVWPEHLRSERRMTDAFGQLVRAIPSEREVAVISPRPPSVRATQAMGREVRYLPLDRVRDVRVRDWAGLPAADADGRLLAVKFRYQPRHLQGREIAQAYDNDQTGRQLGESLYGEVLDVPLTMSGGAMTHNGRGTAIVSQRVIHENEQLAIQEVRDLLEAYAGVNKVVFVPVRPDDADGHLTGLVRFVSENVVLVAQYPSGAEALHEFTEKLAAQIRRELGRGFRVVRIPALADGRSYLDFIHLGARILVPAYGDPSDEEAQVALSRTVPEVQVTTITLSETLWPMDHGAALASSHTIY